VERRTLVRALVAGAVVAVGGHRLVDAAGARRMTPDASGTTDPGTPAAAQDVDASGGPTDGAARADRADAIERRAPADEPPVSDEPADEARPDVLALPAIAVLCRDATGLDAPRVGGRAHRIARMTLHHTAVRHDRLAEAPRRLRAHQRHHLAQGWIDVAYHYGVDLAGNVYELRDVGFAGDTFTDYDPAGHFLVVCEGDYDQQRPTDAMLAAVAGLFANASERFGVPVSTIAGHRDHAGTRCPGASLAAALPSIRDEAARLVGLGAPAIERVCGGEAAARVALIEAA